MTSEIQEKHAEDARAIPVMAVRKLSKTYKVGQTQVRALRGVSLDVYCSEFVAIMGASGSGKSTFMNLIGCLDQATSGDYKLMGTSVSHMTVKELATIRNECLGFVFQGFHLLPRASALNNVALPLLYAGIPKEEQERRARKALEVVGLGTRLNHTPSQLSGGQQQRVAIARALVNNPLLLLADEPTGNLDSRTSVEIMALLQDLNQRGLTIVLVTHEPDIAAYAKRRVTFRDGHIMSDELITGSRSAKASWSTILSKESQDLEPQLAVPTEEASTLSTNPMIQQTAEPIVAIPAPSGMPIASEEQVKGPVTAPLQEQPLRATRPPSKDPQVHRSKMPYLLLLLILLALFGILLTSVGVGMSLRLYTANPHASSALPPTVSPNVKVTATPGAVSTTYPSLVKLYKGTIHDIPGNVSTLMSLSDIQQQQGYITGSFTGLHENSLFQGTITPAKHIQFMVMGNTEKAPIAFDGFIVSDGTIAGTYCILNPAGQCRGYGIWSISPMQP